MRSLDLLVATAIAAVTLTGTGRCQQPQVALPQQQDNLAAGIGDSSSRHEDEDPYRPSAAHAQRNANHIFNAIHSSMRQWGSSLQHNGLSFFPASIPAGTLLYHGDGSRDPPPAREWLAFEIEHAMMFAKHRPTAPGKSSTSSSSRVDVAARLGVVDASSEQGSEPGAGAGAATEAAKWDPGYLQIFRATRALDRVLYFDGSSAGNSPFGMMDTQDLVFLNKSRPPLDDLNRADDLCKLGAEWNIEAFIRMEAGFELIKCNFTDGLQLLSARRTPNVSDLTAYDDRFLFNYMRSVAMRHEGIGANRVVLDYSSMVSSLFYNTNLTNPAPARANYDTSLPRILHTEPEQLYRIRSDLEKVFARERSFQSTVDWQGVVDMIVTRYSERLQIMAGGLPGNQLLAEINTLLNLFVDYGETGVSEDESVAACSYHYLQPMNLACFTEQDHMIFAAIEQVTKEICGTLFGVRRVLLKSQGGKNAMSAVASIRELNAWLNWTTWQFCGHCRPDQVCFVAAWPYGLEEDHYEPKCRSNEEMRKRHHQFPNYWFPDELPELA
ncbi:hypothetical protein PVAG01_05629 [Phlyctema vagabunda]|uniref:Uncharacterized protein n=1 Tax=Phlyctema vagabunda TaxID=108571 RepID=A0ABR4PKP0_9HELO